MPEDKTPKINVYNVYIAYLTVMIYIVIIVLSTDQELLFRAGDKQLPLINISMPIVTLFTWMPWALLVLHFYLLIQVAFLSEKVSLYRQGLNDQLRSRESTRKAKTLVASVPLVHILVEEKAKSTYAILLYLIVFVSLAVFPLMVLIMTQITFLPYQSELITWFHRIVILIDVLMLWYFWHHIFGSHRGKITILFKRIAGVLGILILVFVVIFINFPGNKIYSYATASFYKLEAVNEMMPNRFVSLSRELVKREPAAELLAAYIKGQMGDETLIEPGSPIWCQYAVPLDLRDRNFRKAYLKDAILCGAILQNADFTDANLKDTILTSANLERAILTNARLIRANLTSANLERAILTNANLNSVNLTSANLERVILTNENLRKANLRDANLRRADLRNANLRKADLRNANLRKADLREANLERTNLREANLERTDLREANLERAVLRNVNFSKAELWDADLSKADLKQADLKYADLTAANLSRTDFSNVILNNRTILDLIWVWESSDSEEKYFPMGIPVNWNNKPQPKIKPEYLCPEGFDVSEYIDKDDEVGREQLKAQLKQIIEKKCKPYKP